MQKQIIVIGLGQFGSAVSRALAERGAEVLAVDISEERVSDAAAYATESVALDATDEDALAALAPDRRDVCLVAIGDDAREASIICTALLRQMGAPRVIARANEDVHARILTLVGAHEVVNPEREFGGGFASQLMHSGLRGEMQLGGGVLISEVEAPETFVGSTLFELRLPASFGVTVVALRRALDASVILPEAESVVNAGDILILVGRAGAVASMLDKT